MGQNQIPGELISLFLASLISQSQVLKLELKGPYCSA